MIKEKYFQINLKTPSKKSSTRISFLCSWVFYVQILKVYLKVIHWKNYNLSNMYFQKKTDRKEEYNSL